MSRLRLRTRVAVILATLGVVLGSSPAATAQPQVQQFPTPLRFASSLDLECWRTNAFQHNPLPVIVTRHINRVLEDLPVEQNPLGPREQLCVPVAKNNVIPPPGVLEFVRFVDLACYRTQGINVNRTLRIDHLNPLLSDIPTKSVVITVPVQLCVPVAKNGLFPPAEIRRLVSFIDFKCYLEQPQVALNRPLRLTELNPVLANVPPHDVRVTFNRQLCVPIIKNNAVPPPEILEIVRWLDMEKYDIVTATAMPTLTLRLNHLNPALANLPGELATISGPLQLMLPVAKNGVFPPG